MPTRQYAMYGSLIMGSCANVPSSGVHRVPVNSGTGALCRGLLTVAQGPMQGAYVGPLLYGCRCGRWALVSV